MCTEIQLGDKVIETIGGLVELVGKESIVISKTYENNSLEGLFEPDLCLCPVDIEATANKSGYVSRNGMLEDGDDWFMGYKWTRKD